MDILNGLQNETEWDNNAIDIKACYLYYSW